MPESVNNLSIIYLSYSLVTKGSVAALTGLSHLQTTCILHDPQGESSGPPKGAGYAKTAIQ